MLIEIVVTCIFICLSTAILIGAYVSEKVATWVFLAVCLIVAYEVYDYLRPWKDGP